MGEVHLHQQQLRGDFHAMEEEMMVGQEEVISCLDGYHHQMAAAAAPKPVTVGQQLPLDNQLEVNDPVLLGSLMWLLKKAMDGKIFGEFECL